MKRKIAALMAVVVMALNLNTAFAEDLSGDVKAAIVAAKSKIMIDEDYSEFDYETRQMYNRTVYDLTWRNEDYERYRVTVDDEGDICDYQIPWSYSEHNGILANVRQSEAENNARQFIKKMLPDRAQSLELIETTDNNNLYTFQFAQKINGIFVLYDDTDVSVSKHNGEVMSFSSYGKYFQDMINSKTDDLIDSQKAKEAFIENDSVKLIYRSDFDYKTKKAEIFPVYKINSLSINAHNAKVIQSSLSAYDVDDSAARNSSASSSTAADKAEDAAEDYGLTPSELEMVEKTDTFITSEEALNIAKKYNLIKNGITYKNIGLRKSSYNNDEYFWNFTGENDEEYVNFSIEANSGKIGSFNLNKRIHEKTGEILSEEAAKDKINGWLRLLCPENLNDVVYPDEVEYTAYTDRIYTLSYKRKINNLELDSNYITIRIDAKTGELCSFEKTWYNDISTSPKQIKLTEEEAFDVYRENAEFGLGYAFVLNETNGKFDKADAVYRARKSFNYYIDAENGQTISYWGVARDNQKPSSYSDISGSEYEDIINILFESGFYFDREEFKPNEPITNADFMKLLYSGLEDKAYQRSRTKENAEEFLNNSGLTDSVMTKNSCAGLLMRIIGYDYLADKDEIFADIYADVDLKDRAEAGIAVSASLLTADGDKFGGESEITNGEAAEIIYNLISGFWQNKTN